jgi:hypothetical protein
MAAKTINQKKNIPSNKNQTKNIPSDVNDKNTYECSHCGFVGKSYKAYEQHAETCEKLRINTRELLKTLNFETMFRLEIMLVHLPEFSVDRFLAFVQIKYVKHKIRTFYHMLVPQNDNGRNNKKWLLARYILMIYEQYPYGVLINMKYIHKMLFEETVDENIDEFADEEIDEETRANGIQELANILENKYVVLDNIQIIPGEDFEEDTTSPAANRMKQEQYLLNEMTTDSIKLTMFKPPPYMRRKIREISPVASQVISSKTHAVGAQYGQQDPGFISDIPNMSNMGFDSDSIRSLVQQAISYAQSAQRSGQHSGPIVIENPTFGLNVGSNTESNIKSNAEPSVKPSAEPSVKPIVKPNIKSNVGPNVKPIVKPSAKSNNHIRNKSHTVSLQEICTYLLKIAHKKKNIYKYDEITKIIRSEQNVHMLNTIINCLVDGAYFGGRVSSQTIKSAITRSRRVPPNELSIGDE